MKKTYVNRRTFLLLTLTAVSAAWMGTIVPFSEVSQTYWGYLQGFKSHVGMLRWHDSLALVLVFVGIYSLFGALCLPGTGLLNLTGAGLFPPVWALVAICLARAVGGVVAFVVIRKFFGDKVGKRFPQRLEKVRTGFARDGGLYLFALRVTPGLPYPVTNMLMGLTTIRPTVFFWVTLLGSVPGTLLTVNAIHRLTGASSPTDLFSPSVFISLALLGVLPLVFRKCLALVHRKRPAASLQVRCKRQ